MLSISGQNAPLTFLHRPFGMKKHWASRLHYDLRLEWNGRLLSWALPMGPTRTPGVTRKAIQMVDHDPESLDFEGVHFSGTIMFWDRGSWKLHPDFQDVQKCLEQGVLRFELHGEKLEGNWTLARTTEDQHGLPIWVLSKDDDGFAVEGTDTLLEDQPDSIKTKRTREEIEREWREGKGSSGKQDRLF